MNISKVEKDRFPYSLDDIYSPPKNMYVLGKLPDGNLTPITVIGGNSYTQYERLVAIELMKGLKDRDIVIVSTLDSPLNSIILKEAIKNKIPTLVILPSGLSKQVMFPKTNLSLTDELIENGAIISEYSSNQKADKKKILARNRILGGISELTVIIECDKKSQEKIVGKFAIEYGKELGVVPHDIFSQSGTNDLIKEGAHPITSSEDILEILGKDIQKKVRENLTKNEKEVLKLLPLSKEEIKNESKLNVEEIQNAILLLEMKGLIKEKMGVISST